MDKKHFLINELPVLLQQLKADTEPAFGLMTPQHMVEHLTGSIKVTTKRSGEPDPALAEKQMGFQRFIANGAILKHRPSNKTKADLPPLKYASLEEAISHLPEATERFYRHYETHPDFKAYHSFMGELGFEELELFHYQHCRYHFWQFGLLPEYYTT